MSILRKMKIQKFEFCTLIHPAKIFKDADLFTDKLLFLKKKQGYGMSCSQIRIITSTAKTNAYAFIS